MKRILITNDDGIEAPGIRALINAVADLGAITVVAPRSEQSAVGHGITLHTPVRVERRDLPGAEAAFAVDGAPADCVKLAVAEFLNDPPDLVLSGINNNVNFGINAVYSGTVAGAIEASMYGLTGVAISTRASRTEEFNRAAEIAHSLAEQLLSRPVGQVALNLNVPPEGARGLRVVPQNTAPFEDTYQEVEKGLYQIGGEVPVHPPRGDDRSSFLAGYATLTPLQFDLTDHDYLARIRAGQGGWKEIVGAARKIASVEANSSPARSYL